MEVRLITVSLGLLVFGSVVWSWEVDHGAPQFDPADSTCGLYIDDSMHPDHQRCVQLFDVISSQGLHLFEQWSCPGKNVTLRCPYATKIQINWGEMVYDDNDVRCPMPQGWGEVNNVEEEENEEGGGTRGFERKGVCTTTSQSLGVALRACQERRQCSVAASVDNDGEEQLCHGPSKYLRITYKCKPEAFKTRITCEGRDMHLVCKKHQRLAFYSALYGTSEKGTIECPSNSTGIGNDCVSQCSLDEVVRLCQGQRRCNVPVTRESFGDPCPPQTQKYLKVKYSCVSKRILKKITEDNEYPHFFCGKEVNQTIIEAAGALPIIPSTMIFSTAIPSPAPNTTCLPPDRPEIEALEDRYIGFLADWVNMWKYLQDNEEKIILYFVISLLSAIILLLLVIICKLHRKRRRKLSNSSQGSSPAGLVTPTMAPMPPSRASRVPAELPLLAGEPSPDSTYQPVEMLSFQNHGTFSRSPAPEPPRQREFETNGNFGGNNGNNNTHQQHRRIHTLNSPPETARGGGSSGSSQSPHHQHRSLGRPHSSHHQSSPRSPLSDVIVAPGGNEPSIHERSLTTPRRSFNTPRNVSVVVNNDDEDIEDIGEDNVDMPRPPPPHVDPATFSLGEERMNFNSATMGSRSFDNYYR